MAAVDCEPEVIAHLLEVVRERRAKAHAEGLAKWEAEQQPWRDVAAFDREAAKEPWWLLIWRLMKGG